MLPNWLILNARMVRWFGWIFTVSRYRSVSRILSIMLAAPNDSWQISHKCWQVSAKTFTSPKTHGKLSQLRARSLHQAQKLAEPNGSWQISHKCLLASLCQKPSPLLRLAVSWEQEVCTRLKSWPNQMAADKSVINICWPVSVKTFTSPKTHGELRAWSLHSS